MKLEEIPLSFFIENGMVPIEENQSGLWVGVAGQHAWLVQDQLRWLMEKPIFLKEMSESDFLELVQREREKRVRAKQSQLDFNKEKTVFVKKDLLDIVNEPPIIQWVNLMLYEALQCRATDVHLQMIRDSGLEMRFRIDGFLVDRPAPTSIDFAKAVISRLKMISGMDVTELRKPQDGSAALDLGNIKVDIRTATFPTQYGERIVIRILQTAGQELSLGQLGLTSNQMVCLEQCLSKASGMILVTGPTGSGKTTTLYACLKKLDDGHHNIMTIEDPIEYQLSGIAQTQVRPEIGLDFSHSLRSILRQDPDIIFVGEIRDQETAETAIRAAQTGHLVLSTLHTRDAASSVARLRDLGIAPYLISSSLSLVVAQQLVRLLCPVCNNLNAKNCQNCQGLGFKGRTGIFEFLPVNDFVRNSIHTHFDEELIRTWMMEQTNESLWKRSHELTQAHVTTQDEAERILSRG